MKHLSLPSWAEEAQKALNTRSLMAWNSREVHGPCPSCGGIDRFIVWVHGKAWCRKCKMTARWRDWGGNEKEAHYKEQRQKRQRAAFLMQGRTGDWIKYHKQVIQDDTAQDLWKEHEIELTEIYRWGLGFCSSCPSCPGSPSLTIPVFGRGQTLDIRHRLINGASENGGKYRSHVPGISAFINLYNRDALRTKRVTIVEGSKKALRLENSGIRSSGIYGIGNCGELMAAAGPSSSFVLALDPDVEDETNELGKRLVGRGAKVWIASFPLKPDDFILRYGPKLARKVLQQARRVPGKPKTGRERVVSNGFSW